MTMHSGNPFVVTGFWSYSRKLEKVGGDSLHKEMRDCLIDQFSPLGVELWRDSDPEGGIGSGRNWPSTIVGALSRSLLFFWIQSPRWLDRKICRLEFEAFRDRVRRLAGAFPGNPDPDELWGLLVTPVHVMSVRPETWELYDPDVRQRYQTVWLETQRHRMLDLSFLMRSHDPLAVDTRALCLGAAHDIYEDLIAATKMLGTTLRGLLEYAAQPDQAFEAHWRKVFHNFDTPDLPGGPENSPDDKQLLMRQKRLADLHSSGDPHKTIQQTHLTMLLLPTMVGQDGFWCSHESAQGQVAATAAELLPDDPPRRSAAGYMLWSEHAIRVVLP
jgi:hypothetical protein